MHSLIHAKFKLVSAKYFFLIHQAIASYLIFFRKKSSFINTLYNIPQHLTWHLWPHFPTCLLLLCSCNDTFPYPRFERMREFTTIVGPNLTWLNRPETDIFTSKTDIIPSVCNPDYLKKVRKCPQDTTILVLWFYYCYCKFSFPHFSAKFGVNCTQLLCSNHQPLLEP